MAVAVVGEVVVIVVGVDDVVRDGVVVPVFWGVDVAGVVV